MSDTAQPATAPASSPVAESKPADTKPTREGADAPKKLELTEAELEQRIAQAKADAKKEIDDAEAAKKAKAEADEAKKKGEYEALYKEAAAQLAERDHRDAVRDAVAKAAKDHDGYGLELFQKYVGDRLLLTLKPGTAPEDITKAAKLGVKQYADDNPREKPKTFNPSKADVEPALAGATNGNPNPFINRIKNM